MKRVIDRMIFMSGEVVEITVFERADCHLCEAAVRALTGLDGKLSISLAIRRVDIDSDPSLAIYSNDVPVGFVQGQEVFRHRVDVDDVLERIESIAKGVWPGELYATDLASEACVPCRGGVPPLDREANALFLRQLSNGWTIVGDHHLERSWMFPDFRGALAFTNQVGELAEQQGHHPDITLKWGSVALAIWTHAIDGLTRSDFVLAAKIDRL